ncbi:MAG TPA: arsenate reductase ArsC [bacterium]|nr:arsenate reductase ArsC [bacterium]
MIRVLFVCIHNSARSQMAEAYLNALGGGRFEAKSAGIEPGKLNPVVVEAMRLDGIDISHNRVKAVEEFIERGERFDYLITVCDETAAERCPFVPGTGQRLHFGFPDPSAITGTVEERLATILPIRDAIKQKIIEFIGGHP